MSPIHTATLPGGIVKISAPTAERVERLVVVISAEWGIEKTERKAG